MLKLRKNLLVGLMAALLGLGLTACPEDDADDPGLDDPGLEDPGVEEPADDPAAEDPFDT